MADLAWIGSGKEMANDSLTIEQRLHRIEAALGIGDSPEAEAKREDWQNMSYFMNAMHTLPLNLEYQTASDTETQP